MGKPDKRAGRHAGTVHDLIREQAAALRRMPRPGATDLDDVPELAALLLAARRTVEAAMPAAVDFEGRRYFLRLRMVLGVDVFAAQGDAEPLFTGAALSPDPGADHGRRH